MEMVDSQKQVTWCEAVLKVRAGKASKRNCKHAALEWSSDALLGALREGQKGIGDEAVSLEDVAMEVITPLVIMQTRAVLAEREEIDHTYSKGKISSPCLFNTCRLHKLQVVTGHV